MPTQKGKAWMEEKEESRRQVLRSRNIFRGYFIVGSIVFFVGLTIQDEILFWGVFALAVALWAGAALQWAGYDQKRKFHNEAYGGDD